MLRANHISASMITSSHGISGSVSSTGSFGNVNISSFLGSSNLTDFSSSVASRLGTSENNLTAANISGSWQGALGSTPGAVVDSAASQISGAFAADSASLKSAIVTNTGNISTNTSTGAANASAITTLQGRDINTGTGLTGGGDLSADRTLAVDFADSTLQANISGAFATDSSSLAGRVATMEGDAANAQGLATTNSPTFAGMTINGDLLAQRYIVSSSVTHFTQSFSSGSTGFGDGLTDTHAFTGSINVSGSAGSPSLTATSQIKVSNDGSTAPFDVSGNTLKVNNLNADRLDDTELSAIPAYVATNLAANAVSTDKVQFSANTIPNMTASAARIPSITDVVSVTGTAVSSASFAHIEGEPTGRLIGRETQIIRVTQADDGGNDRYHFDGVSNPNLTLEPGKTYRFDLSHSSNSSKTFALSETQNGSHGGGSAYTTNVVSAGTPGSDGAYLEITMAASTANKLFYYDGATSGVGTAAHLLKGDLANLPYATVTGNISGSATSTGSFGHLIVDGDTTFDNGDIITTKANGLISGSATSTGSFGRLVTEGDSSIGGVLTIPGISNVSSSIAAAVAGGVNQVTLGTGITGTGGTGNVSVAVDFEDATFKSTVSGSFTALSASLVSRILAEETTPDYTSAQISGSWQGAFSGGSQQNIVGGVSGSATSTGSFGDVVLDSFATGQNLSAFSASIATRMLTEETEAEGQFHTTGSFIATTNDVQITGSTVISAPSTVGESTASLTVEGSGSNVFAVEGDSGRLFTISDTLSGSLFSVADFSGLPSFEVFDNDKITLGLDASPLIIETNAANTSAMISGSSASTASFGRIVSSDSASVNHVALSGDMMPAVDNSSNLGSETNRFANIFVGDLMLSNKTRINPETNDVGNSIDGTWGDFQLQEGHEDLYIQNKRTGKTFKFVLQEVDTQEL